MVGVKLPHVPVTPIGVNLSVHGGNVDYGGSQEQPVLGVFLVNLCLKSRTTAVKLTLMPVTPKPIRMPRHASKNSLRSSDG